MIAKQADLPLLRTRFRHKRLVFTSGSFDILHVGHIDLLHWCREKGDLVFVALNTDAVIRQKKGVYRPINPLQQRLAMIDELRSVDYVVGIEGEDAATIPSLETAALLRPDICVLGPDWDQDEVVLWQERMSEAEVVIAPKRLGPSTSAIVEHIRSLL